MRHTRSRRKSAHLFECVSVCAALTCLAASARAWPAAQEPAQPQPQAQPQVEAQAQPQPQPQFDPVRRWDDAYQHARARLLAGDFGRAAALFYDLSQRAPDTARRSAAAEMWALSMELDRRGLAFVEREDLGEAAFSAKAVDERTTDEIAILYLNAVFYGLGTGLWAAVQTEPDSAAGFILPALAFSGVATGGVALADSQDLFRYGVPQSIVSGGYIGLGEGLVWTLWNQARVRRTDEWDEKTLATLIWGSTTVGAVAGGVIGSLAGTTPGRASYVGSTALWSGVVFGLLAAAVSEDDEHLDDNALLAGALALNAGAVGGIMTAGGVAPSIARVRFLDLGGIGGGLLLGGLYVAATDDEAEPRPGAALVAAGVTGGLVGAWLLTANMPRDVRADERERAPTAPVSNVRFGLVPTHAGLSLGMTGEL